MILVSIIEAVSAILYVTTGALVVSEHGRTRGGSPSVAGRCRTGRAAHDKSCPHSTVVGRPHVESVIGVCLGLSYFAIGALKLIECGCVAIGA
jgi:hypothetical protein